VGIIFHYILSCDTDYIHRGMDRGHSEEKRQEGVGSTSFPKQKTY